MRLRDVFMQHVKISNFKLKMTDPNNLIYFSYQTLVENQILCFFEIFLLFFWRENRLYWTIQKCSNQAIFSWLKKIAKKFQKNIKFNFLQEFDIENKLNGLNQSFIT
jgi:hypothetical protein